MWQFRRLGLRAQIRVVENVAVVGRRSTRAHAALQHDALPQPRVHETSMPFQCSVCLPKSSASVV